MRVFVLSLLFALSAFYTAAQTTNPQTMDLSNYGVRIEPDKRLIVVLATLEMASTKAESGQETRLVNTSLSESGRTFRDRLQTDFAGVPADLQQKISVFVAQYKKKNPQATDAEIVAPFVSMAYTLTPVPELSDPVITRDLPGTLLDVLDFAPLVREFYRRSGIGARLDDYVKEYQKASDGTLRPSAREMVSELLDYLHTRPQTLYTQKVTTQIQKGKSKSNALQRVETVEHERRFFIVPELLAPNGNISYLNIHDDYYVIVPPDTNLGFSEARRAFLHFVVDALTLNNSKEISTIKDGIKQLLDERRKSDPQVSPDVFLAVSRSLVAAADARQIEFEKTRIATQQARLKIDMVNRPDEKRAVSAELDKFNKALADETALRLSEEYEKGAVLSFYFADQLKGLEDSGFDIASSMREMILSLDASKETNRLDQFKDARARAVAAREERKKNPEPKTIIAENPVTVRLLEIQKTIDAKNYAQANTDLKQLLEKDPSEPRIYYNLGRVASLSAEGITDRDEQNRKLLEAKVAYENVIRSATPQTDAALISLSYVALAKIYEFYENPSYAIKIYDAAIKIGDVQNGAYKEAIAGKQRLVKDQK